MKVLLALLVGGAAGAVAVRALRPGSPAGLTDGAARGSAPGPAPAPGPGRVAVDVSAFPD